MSGSSVLELPDFVDDIDMIAQLGRDSAAVSDGSLLFAGVHALRFGHVFFGPNKSKDGEGWKGVAKYGKLIGRSTSAVSKATRVVTEFLQEALECPLVEVRSVVLMFVEANGSGGVDKLYKDLVAAERGDTEGEGEAEYDGLAAFCTVIASLRKRDVSDAEIAALFATAIGG